MHTAFFLYTMNRNLSTSWALLLISLLVFGSSCVKEDEITDTTDYPEFIVFGTFFMENSCGGAETCIEIYKADAAGLSEDVLDNEPNGDSAYPGDYSDQLSSTAYENVMDMFKNNPIPQDLLDSPNGQLGNLNQFGQNFYLEFKTKSGGYQYWILGGAFDGSLQTSIQNYINVISSASFFASQG